MSFNYDPEVSLEEAEKLLKVSDSVMEEFTNRGFALTKIPVAVVNGQQQYFYGHIPPNLTELTDKELGDYLGLMTEWINYCSDQKTIADITSTEAKEILETFEAKLRLKHKSDSEGKRISNPERDDIVKADRQILIARSKYQYLHAYYKLVASQLKNAEQRYAAISRRITQTTNSNDRHNRNTNISNTPQPGGHPLFRGGRR